MDASQPADKRILRWGNSYGIRLTKAEVEALGLHEGDGVRVEVKPRHPKIDWDTFPGLDLGPDSPHDLSVTHDDAFYEAWLVGPDPAPNRRKREPDP